MTDLRLDSHKLIFHPEAVSNYLKTGDTYPLEIEVSPSGACNHRCVFCSMDYLGYKPEFLDADVLLTVLRFLAGKGLKSVVFAGEGEPLLNKDLGRMASETKKVGIDIAMSTNGALMTRDYIDNYLHLFSWIRFSIAGIKQETYSKIQRAKAGDLEKALGSLKMCAEFKKENNFGVTLGVQCLLLDSNKDELVEMAQALRTIGADYFTIKPYIVPGQSNNKLEVSYEYAEKLKMDIQKEATESFSIYFRTDAIRRLETKKTYAVCHGMPFFVYIDSKGNVCVCVQYIGDSDFNYGNIYEQSFEEIWEGEKRRQIEERLSGEYLHKNCRKACRLDVMNNYLHELKHPGEHVNFI
ncbi:MAG: radical SAM protein [Prevotella sp.]|jgi:radical SAM protein with 4Fe4S-binding SPASM domain|nr:radical SAM protein [Prevotella sp.]